MNIKELLKGISTLIEKKIDMELKNQIDILTKQDISITAINNIKQIMIDNLKSVNDTVRINNEEEDLYSDKDLEKIIKIDESKIKLTKQTQKQIDIVIESTKRKKEKLNNMLNEVYLLSTYLEKSEQVTELLISYNILTKERKINMDII